MSHHDTASAYLHDAERAESRKDAVAAATLATTHALLAVHDLLRDLPHAIVKAADEYAAQAEGLLDGGPTGPSWPAEYTCDCGRAIPCRHCEVDTLVEALDALPEGTIVYDCDGDRWRHAEDGWHVREDRALDEFSISSFRIVNYAPIGIESIPGEDVLPHDPEPETVTVTLPERILGRPWTVVELRMLAEWADNAGSGEAGAVLGHVADALDAASATQEADQ